MPAPSRSSIKKTASIATRRLIGADAKDEVIFAGIKERGWFLVTLDAKMSRRPAQRQAILDAGLGVFAFTGSSLAQRSFREIASFVLSVTDAILAKAQSTKRPFIWGISDRRVFDRLDRPK